MMYPVMMVMMGMIRRREVDGGWLGCSINLDSLSPSLKRVIAVMKT